MKIESNDIDVENLLSGSYFFIPRFQRPYSWDDENIDEFWNDLNESDGDEYFIGSMVCYKERKQLFGVVDGQQRLTTITILLCVLRDSFQKLGYEDDALGIQQLIERKNRKNKNEYVLRTETSYPYFQEYIQKFDEDPDVECKYHEEEASLARAYEVFRELLDSVFSSIDSDDSIAHNWKRRTKLNRIRKLSESVLNLKLILITLDNEDDAYIIFETLNTRGKDLALTDLVKNHFSKLLKSGTSVDHTREKWSSMLDIIYQSSSDISTDNFIYHYWSSRYEATKITKLFKKFKRKVTKSKAKEHLDSLLSDAKLYRSIYEPDYGWTRTESKVSRSLMALQMFKVTQPIPAILSIVRAYKEEKIKLGKLKGVLLAFEKYHFMFTAITSSKSSGGTAAMYSAFAKKIFEAKDSQAVGVEARAFTDKLRSRIPDREEFTLGFSEVRFTNANSKQRRLVRYVLRGFVDHMGYKFPGDFDDLTIEHIQPQSLSGDGDWDEDSVGCLGNLILLDAEMNQKLADKPFKEKKRLLKQNGYTLPEYISRAKVWTPEKAKEHTVKLANLAYDEIWKF